MSDRHKKLFLLFSEVHAVSCPWKLKIGANWRQNIKKTIGVAEERNGE
jgi:hypothetical protein